MTDSIPQITITPKPLDDDSAIVSKFYGGNNPSSPAAAGKTDDGFSFSDIVDVINPLQNLPIIGTIYRAITGDEASPQAKVAGGALYGTVLGGPIGALFSMASAVFGDLFGIDETLNPKAVAAMDAPKTEVAKVAG